MHAHMVTQTLCSTAECCLTAHVTDDHSRVRTVRDSTRVAYLPIFVHLQCHTHTHTHTHTNTQLLLTQVNVSIIIIIINVHL